MAAEKEPVKKSTLWQSPEVVKALTTPMFIVLS